MTNVTVDQRWLITVCVLLVIGSSLSSGQTTTSKNVICYYNYLLDERSGVTTYNTLDIDPSVCTHLVYDQVRTDDGIVQTSDYHGFSYVEDLKNFQDLSQSNPLLKVILGVNEGSYPPIEFQSYENRQTFIRHVIDFLRTWDFDGVNFVWNKRFKSEAVTFIGEVREAFVTEATSSGREPLILMLTMLGWGGITDGVDLQPLGQAVDILHASPTYVYEVASYITTFVSPMYGNGGIYGNVSASVTDYLKAGIPSEKLHIGIKLAASTFKLFDSENTRVGAPANRVADPGEYTQNPFTISYYEVCKRLQEEGYTAEFDPEGLVNFAYKGDQWMSYEDPASLQIKMDYVYDNNLGGIAVLYLNDDDYTGQFCSQGSYPLISTLYRFTSEKPTTTIMVSTTTATCPGTLAIFPDPYSCQHYRMCVFDMLFRVACFTGLSYDSVQKVCVQIPTTNCVTVPPPTK